jgi:hypothetical protein
MADDAPRRYAPYLAWRTLFNLILEMAETGLPSRIDRSFLNKKSGLDQTYLIATMKAFDLIEDDGTVREPLKRLVADIEGRTALVAELLRANYPEVFALPDNATQQQLDDVLQETFGLTGATTRKATTFLMHAAAFANVRLSPHLKTPRGVASAGSATRANGQKRQRRTTRAKAAASPAISAAVPQPARPAGPPDMKERYFEFLLKKAETAEDKELLDRIERLIGIAAGESDSPSDQ